MNSTTQSRPRQSPRRAPAEKGVARIARDAERPWQVMLSELFDMPGIPADPEAARITIKEHMSSSAHPPAPESVELATLVVKAYTLGMTGYPPEAQVKWLFELPMPDADGKRFKELYQHLTPPAGEKE